MFYKEVFQLLGWSQVSCIVLKEEEYFYGERRKQLSLVFRRELRVKITPCSRIDPTSFNGTNSFPLRPIGRSVSGSVRHSVLFVTGIEIVKVQLLKIVKRRLN